MMETMTEDRAIVIESSDDEPPSIGSIRKRKRMWSCAAQTPINAASKIWDVDGGEKRHFASRTPVSFIDILDSSSPALPSPGSALAGLLRGGSAKRKVLQDITRLGTQIQKSRMNTKSNHDSSDPIVTSSDPVQQPNTRIHEEISLFVHVTGESSRSTYQISSPSSSESCQPITTQKKKQSRKIDRHRSEESKKVERQLSNELKKVERQRSNELKNVNKLKKTKLEQTKEMIVVFHSSLYDPYDDDAELNDKNAKLGNILRPKFIEMECDLEVMEEEEVDMANNDNAPPPNTIIWKRKVAYEFDEEKGYNIPLEETLIKEEQFVLYIVTAEEYVQHISDVSSLLEPLKSTYPKKKVILILQGLKSYMQKIKTSRMRKFQAAVRRGMETGNTEYVDIETGCISEQDIEFSLLELQLVHKCFIMQTRSRIETLEWIPVFTTDIATIPYKRQNSDLLAFCTDVGQVKTGKDAMDTFHRMLQEIPRVTPGISESITKKYSTLCSLMQAFEKHGDDVLSNLEIKSTKSGAPSNRHIGQALSKKIYHVFMTKDPSQLVS